jgi:hypothetical protein
MTIINRSACPPLGTYDQNFDIDWNGNQLIVFKAMSSTNPPVFNLIQDTGDPEAIFTFLQELHEQISQFYNVDLLLDLYNEKTMTLGEAEMRDRKRDVSLKDLFQSRIDEKYTPLLNRAFNLLFRAGKFNDIINNALESDENLLNLLNSGEDIFEINYYNKVNMQSANIKINSIMSLLTNAGTIASMTGDPSIFDNFDMDKIVNLFKTINYFNLYTFC